MYENLAIKTKYFQIKGFWSRKWKWPRWLTCTEIRTILYSIINESYLDQQQAIDTSYQRKEKSFHLLSLQRLVNPQQSPKSLVPTAVLRCFENENLENLCFKSMRILKISDFESKAYLFVGECGRWLMIRINHRDLVTVLFNWWSPNIRNRLPFIRAQTIIPWEWWWTFQELRTASQLLLLNL